eukprot:5202976-Karenia_brevis.AAC.1
MQTNCEGCNKCTKCHKLQNRNNEHKCQRHRNCLACYFRKHHGIVLNNRAAQIIKQINKYRENGKVTDHNEIQEAPTCGTS